MHVVLTLPLAMRVLLTLPLAMCILLTLPLTMQGQPAYRAGAYRLW